MKRPFPVSFNAPRSYRLAVALACAFTAAVGVAWAQTRIDPSGASVNGSVIGDDVLYSIGGGGPCPWAAPETCKASASGSAGTAT